MWEVPAGELPLLSPVVLYCFRFHTSIYAGISDSRGYTMSSALRATLAISKSEALMGIVALEGIREGVTVQ